MNHVTFLRQALSSLVQIASVRRSLFNNCERAKFLNQLIAGVKDILQNPQVSIGTPSLSVSTPSLCSAVALS